MLRTLDWCCKNAIFELELETCISWTRFALQSCDFPETCTSRATLVPESFDIPTTTWNPVLCALDLHYKVAIFLRVLDF